MVELAERIAAAVRHPRRQGLLHHLAAPRPTTPRCCWPPSLPRGPTRSSRCATATTAGRSPRSRSPATGPGRRRRSRRSRPTTCTAATATAARSRGLADDEFIAACVADLRDVLDQARRRRRRADRRADPGRRRVHLAARRAARRVRARCSTSTASCGSADEVQTGWGRTGEHFWGWQAHAASGPPDIAHLRQGHRQRPVDRRRDRPRRDHGLPATPTRSRRSAASRSPSAAGAGQPRATCSSTTCRATPRRSAADPARAACARSPTRRSSATCAARGLMIGVELVRPGTGRPATRAAAGARRAGGRTKRRGLLVGKGGLHGNVLRIAPPLSLTDGRGWPRRDRGPAAARRARRPIEGGRHHEPHADPQRPGHHRRRRDRTPTC